VVADVSDSLLSRPAATLGQGHLSGYVTELAGGVVLLAGGIAAALANRRAAVAAAATALSVLAWAAAPVTGVSRLPEFGAIAVSALRYLLPAVACGAAALALAALGPRRAAKAGAGVLLGAAVAWGIVRDAQVGFPVVPSATTLVIGAVVGALIAWAAGWLLVRVPLVATAVVVALALALAAPGYLDRHGQASTAFDPGVSRFLAAQPGYGDGDAPVALAPSMAGPLAGDRVRHRLSLLRTGTPCSAVRRAARSGYVVLRAVRSIELQRRPRIVFPAPVTARACLAPARPIYARNGVEVYALR
jgi:hypothetical protein